MGRRSKFHAEQVLDAALRVLEREGLGALTMTRVCDELGAASGSLYHRFPSRDALRVALWLRSAERFQAGLIELLERPGDARETAQAGVRYVIERARRHRGEALILMSYRREELIEGPWPAEVTERARALERAHQEAAAAFSRRLWPHGEPDLERMNFALVGIPVAAAMAELRGTARDTLDWAVMAMDALLADRWQSQHGAA